MSDDPSKVIAIALASEYSIFLSALDMRSTPERDAFLDEACEGDAHLRASVEDLLRAHDQSDNLLDASPAHAETPPPPAGVAEGPGLVIGGYKLIEQIGEGGFGLVFVAEQQKPVRRKVALKIVKPGMDTREVIARFEAERQALAVMDHPNIARVFDAGATAMGRPFFVMELVRGVPINEYCDQQELTVRQRLELFIDVCYAVQHAHTKGIIHRDLKPTNILVASHDGVPVAKVIDFGVAKAVGHSLTDKTIYTRFAEMIGTPIYMSPEQAELSGLDVDTRSDIYSLGVILYELLTGTTPADPKQMKVAAFDEVRRIIREVEALPPSTRLTTLGQALATVSSKRNIEPRKLQGLLRGDIDWIVMKALEKDRTRRYQTPIAFAEDVRRYLKGVPIEARPPSKAYRFQKFARRNVAPLVTATLVFAALVAGTVVSTWQAFRARAAERRVTAERDAKEHALAEARAERKNAEDANARLQVMNTSLTRGRSLEERRRWAGASAAYSQAIEAAPDSYHVWRERGSFYARLGLWTLAAADYQKAVDLGLLAAHQPYSAIPELMLLVGDHESYDKMCTYLTHTLRMSPDSRSTLRMIRSLCIDPESSADVMALARRADRALKKVGATPDQLPPAVLVHYRAGHYKRALKLAEEAAQLAGPHLPMNHALLAMIYYRLDEPEKSSASLALAGKALDQYFAQKQKSIGTDVGYWFEWIPCFLLYSEAQTLIHESAPKDRRMKEVEVRVLAALPELGAPLRDKPGVVSTE